MRFARLVLAEGWRYAAVGGWLAWAWLGWEGFAYAVTGILVGTALVEARRGRWEVRTQWCWDPDEYDLHHRTRSWETAVFAATELGGVAVWDRWTGREWQASPGGLVRVVSTERQR